MRRSSPENLSLWGLEGQGRSNYKLGCVGGNSLWLASGALLKKSPSLGEHDLRRLPELDPTPALRDTVLPDGVSGRLMQIAFVPQRDEDEDNSEVGANTGEAKKDAAAEQHKDEAEEADDAAESLVQQLNARLRRQQFFRDSAQTRESRRGHSRGAAHLRPV